MKVLAAIRGCIGHDHVGGMELISHIIFRGLIKRGLDTKARIQPRSAPLAKLGSLA